MRANQLSQLSSNQHMFNNAAVVYEEAIQKSGYHNKLKYQHSSNLTKPASNQCMFNNAAVVYQEVIQKKWILQQIEVPAFKQSHHTSENKNFYGLTCHSVSM